MHLSLWDMEGKTNLFHDDQGELGLSALAYHFIAGVLAHGEALCAFTSPTVNSYRRLSAPVTLSGATWSPSTLTYTRNNRTHVMRIPDSGRFELRLADGAANPYLLTAAVIAASLDGIVNKLEPGPRYDNNSYTDPLPKGTVKEVPQNLMLALEALDRDPLFRDRLGSDCVDAYLKLKSYEWQQFRHRVTPWERETTLDC
ncbi:hypothetical protein [Thermosynechococcus sp. HN-54]|uniref:hypothetical protein n=1 Tax=Thermosynechococcus sp. HN-54 TaxID=2933959 RepID=UPI00202CA85D